MYHSKAHDSMPHELLIAKLECYVLDKTSLRVMLDYLTNRKQRAKTASGFSSWYGTGTGVEHGPILGPLLLFFSITKSEVCNFADDNTL